MTLTVDIGNSWCKIGRQDAHGSWMVDRVATTDVAASLAARDFDRVAFASVVPDAAKAVRVALEGRGVFEVSWQVKLPFAMGYETPQTLGNDRIAAAAGALLEYGREGRAVIAVDAGTAVTYEVVDAERTYRGGAIAPGPGLMASALNLGTAQLPEVDAPLEGTAIGVSTREALRSGVYWGFVDAVGGMLDRLRDEVGDATVVLTGGWAGFLAGHLAGVHVLDPHLVLRGIAALDALNAG
ncbi:MAG: type III pantothenate kinase [Rhodothermales bacterium]|nr:type III pantothenate kinase [Rhodothermales bacterium]